MKNLNQISPTHSKPRLNLTPPAALNPFGEEFWVSTRRSSPPARSRTGVLRVREGELNNEVITQKNLQKRALKRLCIGFELALFFLASQLPILTYQSVKKALTAFLQMLRLALFSQTNPISPCRRILSFRQRPDMIPAEKKKYRAPAKITEGRKKMNIPTKHIVLLLYSVNTLVLPILVEYFDLREELK